MKNQTLLCLLVVLFGNTLAYSQSTEDFETETTGSTTFTDAGQQFIITNGPGETTYDIEFFSAGGWNGSGPDDRFIDNTDAFPPQGDGTSFSIATVDGTDISIKSLYLFVSTRNLNPGVSTTLTLTGRRDGSVIYTIVKSNGIVDGGTFSPNNGFTFIDFSTEGGADNSNMYVDEITFSSTGNADYFALDAFRWEQIVLPVELLSFQGTVANKSVLLSWKTASELNNEKFEIEESMDGLTFQKIGESVGRGTYTGQQDYSFTIDHPYNGVAHYRLKQIDFDGQFDYSEVITVNYTGAPEKVGAFYPNPSTLGRVNLDYVAQQDEAITITVFDLSGKRVISNVQRVSRGLNKLSFNWSELNTGMYTARIGEGRNATHRTFIVEK